MDIIISTIISITLIVGYHVIRPKQKVYEPIPLAAKCACGHGNHLHLGTGGRGECDTEWEEKNPYGTLWTYYCECKRFTMIDPFE